MTRYRTTGLFVLLAALWGGSFVAARATVETVPPVLLAALRFDVAGVVVLGFAWATVERWYPRGWTEWRVVLVAGTTVVAAHHALLFAGQQYVTSAVASVVVSLDPVLAAGFAWVLLGRRLRSVQVGGIALALVGAVAVAAPTPARLAGTDPVGVGLVFGAAVAFALGAVLVRRLRPSGMPQRTMQAWAMLVGAPLLHLATLVVPGEAVLPTAVGWSPPALAGLAYLALAAGGAGYLLYFVLLERLGAIEVNLVGYLAPVLAGAGGWLVLGEAVAPTTAAGYVVVLAGFGLLNWRALSGELDRFRQRG